MTGGRSRAASTSLWMAISTLVMAGSAALQAVFYLSTFGTTGKTDAFFTAFALYTVFGVFCHAIRVTSVPLLVGEDRRMRGREFAATLALIGVPVLILTEPLASGVAGVLAPGVDGDARGVATDALRILGPAMLAQLGAAGAATLLGVWDRFDVVARAYAGGALTGLASFFAFVGPADELALAWGMCVGSVVTFLWMAVGVQRARLQRSPLAQRSATKVATDAGLLLGRTVVYFVFNALYLVTLAFTTERAAGDATVLSYSYLFASYLVAIASAAVGITRVPDMARGAKADWEAADVVYDTVPHGFRYAALVCAPAMAALVAGGADLVGEILPDSLPPGDVDRMQAFAALLTIWLLAALVVNFLLPALFAIGRARLVNWLSLPMVAVHVGATALAAEIAGVDGIVGAMGVALWVYGAALLALGGGRLAGRVAREIAIDAVAFCALAAGAFAAGWGFASAVVDDSSLAHAIITLAVGGAIYVAGVWFAAPRQVAVLLGRPTGPAT